MSFLFKLKMRFMISNELNSFRSTITLLYLDKTACCILFNNCFSFTFFSTEKMLWDFFLGVNLSSSSAFFREASNMDVKIIDLLCILSSMPKNSDHQFITKNNISISFRSTTFRYQDRTACCILSQQLLLLHILFHRKDALGFSLSC